VEAIGDSLLFQAKNELVTCFPQPFFGGITMNVFKEIVKRSLRISQTNEATGNGEVVARQLDIALTTIGFKLSKEALSYLSGINATSCTKIANDVLQSLRELIGDNVKHNVYFIEFPKNIPDTLEFWDKCILDALCNPEINKKIALDLSRGSVNLLDLPKYGNYQHTFEEMLLAHEQFIPSAKDRIKIVHLGDNYSKEVVGLYHSLAGSAVPLRANDRELLKVLAVDCLSDIQPDNIPVRENRAIINRVRLDNNLPILVDTVTDVLRLSCALSDGDITLSEKTRFKSFSNKVRKALMSALDGVIKKAPAKLADVNQYKEVWKRLGERLHPGEYKLFPSAQEVFLVARGDKKVRTLMGQVELAFMNREILKAVSILSSAPGILFRNIDRIIRSITKEDIESFVKTVQTVIPKVSGKVILSVREHISNRATNTPSRIFANSKGTAWVAVEERKPLEKATTRPLIDVLDNEISVRLPTVEKLLVDREVLNLALPVSEKNMATGFNILPRGTVSSVENGIVRFFIYWKQKEIRTDFDLSAVMLDKDFRYIDHLSYTSLRAVGGVHSGDITDATNGASEFIDIDLKKVKCAYLIPQVLFFSGESFNDVEESFFGFMERTEEQMGQPFEPTTVRMKSDVRGNGRVALPLVFARDHDGNWTVKWLNLFLNGSSFSNQIEDHSSASAVIARSIIERDYITLDYIVQLMIKKSKNFSWYEKGDEITEPVTFIGLEAPENLSKDSKVYTLNNLRELIPA
jgi:hypothetical protein